MKCEHCDARDPAFSYNGHWFCCECMSELCSWFLDGGQVENPDQFTYALDEIDASDLADRLARFGSSGFVKIGYDR